MISDNKTDRFSYYHKIKNALLAFSHEDIEAGIIQYCLAEYGIGTHSNKTDEVMAIFNKLKELSLPSDLCTIVELFEYLLDEDNKDENGIVFTPQYISDYIVDSVLPQRVSPDVRIIDPSCGCGIFLISVAERLLHDTNFTIDEIIENHIFGIDIDLDNVRRCILVLKLLSAKYGGNYLTVEPQIKCCDSLKCSWCDLFSVESFSFIVGNPPYVNPHDMNKKTSAFLKETFRTTQSGVYNIFYAFIEQALKYVNDDGVIGYIVPNNFLSIKSAQDLRIFLQEKRAIKKIVDFGDNMIFRPVRTYNCIMILTPRQNETIEYAIVPTVCNIEEELNELNFSSMSTSSLDKKGWKLVDDITRSNIDKIESQMIPIKEFIRTGIATLKDDAYIICKDDFGYYKENEGVHYSIEEGIVRPIYKVPDLRRVRTIKEAERYIIFPYVKTNEGYNLMSEAALKSQYPMAYKYLCDMRSKLDSRDKGKGAAQGWYAYGRSQGLNKYGKKLLFPTFASCPRFIMVNNENALFCNGYAVYENGTYELELLEKVLNSFVMDYYIRNTSYSIEGGYYCYQKKYVENFSLPWFTEEDISFLRQASAEDVDAYLCNLYGLEM